MDNFEQFVRNCIWCGNWIMEQCVNVISPAGTFAGHFYR